MKLLSRKRILIFSILSIFILAACSGEPEVEEEVIDNNAPFPAFKGFPDKQFEELQLNMPIDHAKIALEKSGFELSQGSNFNYKRAKDSVEIVIPDDQKLSTLKIYLRSKEVVNNPMKLVEFYSENAKRTFESKEFYVFKFEEEQADFKINCLIQSSYVRISATLQRGG